MTWYLDQPRSLDEAVGMLGGADPQVRPIAGGTSLMLQLKARERTPTRLVSLHRLRGELSGVRMVDGELALGAMTTHTEIERSDTVMAAAPVLALLFEIIANIRVRNVATIGGNLAHADPHMDVPPILAALGARVRAVSNNGERWIDLLELSAGAFATVLDAGEVLTEVRVRPQPDRASYAKCTALSAGHDWPGVGVAVVFDLRDGAMADVRVAVCGAEDRVRRMPRVERLLEGAAPGPDAIAAATSRAAEEIDPMTDNRGSAPFKRELVRAYVGRALQTALATDRAAVTL